jgi:hypothetical protein
MQAEFQSTPKQYPRTDMDVRCIHMTYTFAGEDSGGHPYQMPAYHSYPWSSQ